MRNHAPDGAKLGYITHFSYSLHDTICCARMSGPVSRIPDRALSLCVHLTQRHRQSCLLACFSRTVCMLVGVGHRRLASLLRLACQSAWMLDRPLNPLLRGEPLIGGIAVHFFHACLHRRI